MSMGAALHWPVPVQVKTVTGSCVPSRRMRTAVAAGAPEPVWLTVKKPGAIAVTMVALAPSWKGVVPSSMLNVTGPIAVSAGTTKLICVGET